MKPNVGSIDRVLRLALGALLIIAPFVIAGAPFDQQIVGVGAMVVGAVLMLTALVSFCPLYRIIGLRTCNDC
ncbi:MAG: DUF2892 domain-containing protein [Pseudomonadota bacterium]